MDRKGRLVTLANLARGAAVERFDDAFGKICENILDPNTDTQIREITLKVKIKPNENRDFCEATIKCEAKMAGATAVTTQFFIGRDAQGIVATEYNPQQLGLGIDAAEKIAAGVRREGGEET